MRRFTCSPPPSLHVSISIIDGRITEWERERTCSRLRKELKWNYFSIQTFVSSLKSSIFILSILTPSPYSTFPCFKCFLPLEHIVSKLMFLFCRFQVINYDSVRGMKVEKSKSAQETKTKLIIQKAHPNDSGQSLIPSVNQSTFFPPSSPFSRFASHGFLIFGKEAKGRNEGSPPFIVIFITIFNFLSFNPFPSIFRSLSYSLSLSSLISRCIEVTPFCSVSLLPLTNHC